ncbi:MAG: TolC family protein [Bacteroidaceae bacterium]|nr:TolC family protein [Bacteroidaceae bacterium]
MKKYIILAVILSLQFSSLNRANAQTKLTLAQCLDSASRYSLDLRNAALDIDAANLTITEARTKYYPQVSARLLAFRAFDKMLTNDGIIPAEVAAVSPALAEYAGQPYTLREFNSAYSANISAMQPIYTGGQITTANRLAKLQRDVSQLKYRLLERQLQEKIIENYWQIIAVKNNLHTLDAADRQVDSLYHQVELFLKAGVVTRNDLLRVQLRRQELASQRLRLDNAHQVLLLLLAQQIGLADKEIDIEEIPVDVSDYKVGNNSQCANRVESLLASKAVEAAQLQLRMERSKNMPTVAAGLIGYNTGIGGLSSTARQFVKDNHTNMLMMATVSIPISAWWGGSKAIKRRRLELEQARINMQETQEKVDIDNRTAWLNVEQARKQIDVMHTSVEQASENLRISTQRYQAGTETITELLDAETLHRQAQSSLANAIADYHAKLDIYLLKTKDPNTQ